MSIGNALAEGRRQAGLTITEVSRRTCIRETIIRGIERGDYSACGGDFYARGHVRSIARAVDVDPEPLIREYDATEGAPEAISAAEVFQPVTAIKLRESRRPNWTAALALALVVIVGVGIFSYLQFGGEPAGKPSGHPSAAAVTQHPVKPKASPSYPAGQLYISLSARQDCWVSITGTYGQTLFSGMIYAGTSRHWTERSRVFLSVGNPSGIKLRVNGKNPLPQGTISPLTLNLAPGHVPGH